MWKFGNWALLLLLVIVVVEVLTFAPKTLDLVKKKKSTELPPGGQVEQKMSQVHLVETGTAEREWELWANEAVSFKDSEKWRLEAVKVSFYSKDKIAYVVNGDRGEIEADTKNLLIEGKVVVTTSNGYRFTTEKLIYTSKKRDLFSPTKVQVLGPQEPDGGQLLINGKSLRADLQESNIRIDGDVYSTKKIKGDKKLVIRSKEARISNKTLEANFQKDVLMDVETMRITGNRAKLLYTEASKMVELALVEGNVKVTDVDKFATADQLYAYLKEERYELVGSPRLIQNSDELRGEKIIFLNAGKKVQVLRGKASVEPRSKGI